MTASALISPDSFKGTHSAPEVAAAIARGLAASGWSGDECPVGDGGEGTMAALIDALEGELVEAGATDPLGRPIRASFGRLGDRAVVEVAAASGLSLLSDAERDPERASSRGTGELLIAAAERGAREVLIGVGGSATVDGGSGLLAAIDEAGGLPDGLRIVALCDVTTAWEDAARIFGPQKGASEAAVERLERLLDELADELPRDPRGVRRTGAAGGISGALWSRHDAELADGAAFVLDAVGFAERLGEVDLVITGEGRLDEQTAEGKLIGQVAERSRAGGVPVAAIVGGSELSAERARELGIETVIEASTLEEIELAARGLVDPSRHHPDAA